jgi:hypothetical protein
MPELPDQSAILLEERRLWHEGKFPTSQLCPLDYFKIQSLGGPMNWKP